MQLRFRRFDRSITKILIEEHLRDYQIVILSGKSKKESNKFIYINTDSEFHKYIYIVQHQNHYYAIRSINSFYHVNYFNHSLV